MKLKYIFIMVLFFSSCVRKVDYTYPTGYPFAGDIHELKFRYFGLVSYAKNSDKFVDNNNIKKVERKNLCDSIVQLDCKTCNCNSIDFNKEILVNVKAYHGQVYFGEYIPRVLINHKSKSIEIEIDKRYTTGSSGMNSSYTYLVFDKWLVIPKPPKGYSFKDTFK